MDRKISLATRHFEEGHACSQAVLAAFAADFGLDPVVAQKISAVFGGGVGHQGHTCGAVNGAYLAISMAHGRLDPDDEEAVATTDRLVAEFNRRFQERFGAMTCDGLLGIDSSVEGARARAREEGKFEATCPGLVGGAVEILLEIL